MKHTIFKLYYFLIATLCFCTSLPSFLFSPLIILLTVSSLINIPVKKIVQYPTLVALILLYAILGISFFYSNNLSNAAFDLEVKLALLIMPLALLPMHRYPLKFIFYFLKYFLVGLLISICFNVTASLIQYINETKRISNGLYTQNIGLNYFLSARFSKFSHPSYYALILNIGFIVLLYYETKFKRHFKVIAQLSIIVALFLTASKAGLISFLFITLAYVLIKRKYRMGISVIAVSTLICFILINMTPEFANKFTSMKSALLENTDAKTTESSASRILIWKSSLELIMNKPILGYGSGDVKDLLIYKYLQNGYFGIAEKKLNAHNQFLQTQLASGIFGLLMLLFIFIQFLKNSLKNKNWMFTFITIIFFINYLFESMLETQMGVLLFSFWFTLMGIVNQKLSLQVNIKPQLTFKK